MKKSQLIQLIKEIISEEDSWPFSNDSPRVIENAVDRFVAGEKGVFTYLATRASGNEKKLSIILDMIKEKLIEENNRISTKNAKDFQSRFGPGGGQETPSGTYTGD